ncbi:MAG: hypothetical protein ABJA78_08640 [Ferruginibacter sp.]
MKLKFIRNIQFTKLAKVNGRLREFNFRKPNGSEESLFSVDVIDERGSRIIFNMKKTENEWKIVQQDLPDWIMASETTFNNLIQEELNQLQ